MAQITGFGIKQVQICLLRAWVSEIRASLSTLLNFGWWSCLLTTVVWIAAVEALQCDNLARWTILPRILSPVCFWLEWAPTDSSGRLAKCKWGCSRFVVHTHCHLSASLPGCWEVVTRTAIPVISARSFSGFSGSWARWVCLALGQGPGYFRILTTNIRNENLTRFQSIFIGSSSFLLSPTLHPFPLPECFP